MVFFFGRRDKHTDARIVDALIIRTGYRATALSELVKPR
jgi:hypothetical protein